MSNPWYKRCAVLQCTNTSKNAQDKIFVSVPRNAVMRKKWLQLAGRNYKEIASRSGIYFCEDHFDIEKDMENYGQYKMGFSNRVTMVSGVLPSKFNYQISRKRSPSAASLSTSTETLITIYDEQRKFDLIRERKQEIELAEENIEVYIGTGKNVMQKTVEYRCAESLQTHFNKETMTDFVTTADKSLQVSEKQKNTVNYRSKAIQTAIATRNVSISPFKPTTNKYEHVACTR